MSRDPVAVSLAPGETIKLRGRIDRIDVRDDGIGGADCFLPGRGLTNMRDRVLALGGRLHVGELRPGSRIHALFLQ